jgi:hypothetical protein
MKVLKAIWDFLLRANPVLISLTLIIMMVCGMLYENYGYKWILAVASPFALYFVMTTLRMFYVGMKSVIINIFKK